MGPDDPFSSVSSRSLENDPSAQTKVDPPLHVARSYRRVLISVLGSLGGMGIGISSLLFPWHDLLKVLAATLLGYIIARALVRHHEGRLHPGNAWRALFAEENRSSGTH